MTKIVVKCENGLTMKTLSHDFDLRLFGEVTVHRSSEILFDVDAQRFYIKFLEPELEDRNAAMRETFFDTYALAVEKEIEIINEAMLSGVL